MEGLADIHCHLLFGVDDGASDLSAMLAMAQAAYNDGVRLICVTPHYNPALYAPNPMQEAKALEALRDFAKNKLPGLEIYYGNEIFWRSDCPDKLNSGKCKTLGGSRYLLIEFNPGENYSIMKQALTSLTSSGYVPILAHCERYACLYSTTKRAEELCDFGIKLQSNANSIINSSYFVKRFIAKLLKKELIFAVASDAHDTSARRCRLGECFDYISKKYGDEYASRLFIQNPAKIFNTAERIF